MGIGGQCIPAALIASLAACIRMQAPCHFHSEVGYASGAKPVEEAEASGRKRAGILAALVETLSPYAYAVPPQQ